MLLVICPFLIYYTFLWTYVNKIIASLSRSCSIFLHFCNANQGIIYLDRLIIPSLHIGKRIGTSCVNWLKNFTNNFGSKYIVIFYYYFFVIKRTRNVVPLGLLMNSKRAL
ncbi:hypothetical protein Desaci_0833 [Desulfosporosinus acidiphilus SJ4]|uniref:Uncharacterized protein n=1 Tax=Desulfosporosinus acidiphilus (strain DSM 22704 / JCM 16185 / SJ4) TaxID=646529 RepID=I4D265_DESAJ|nr:hypothetical protein Desaci_0833 [Desulfosporosinus acidiphilus SJ4]